MRQGAVQCTVTGLLIYGLSTVGWKAGKCGRADGEGGAGWGTHETGWEAGGVERGAWVGGVGRARKSAILHFRPECREGRAGVTISSLDGFGFWGSTRRPWGEKASKVK